MNAALSTLEAYERWAPRYPPVPHNPLMHAEQRAMLELLPIVHGDRVLDLASGSGRYSNELCKRGARPIAVDFSPSMLRQVSGTLRVRADMVQLPFAAQSFACIVCGLAVGHAENLRLWMHEVARVLNVDGSLLYSDFHPDAIRAGLSRSFKDEQSRNWQLPHHCHGVDDHVAAAQASNLAVEVVRTLKVGEEFQESFAGSEKFYREWAGLPLILVVKVRKSPTRCAEDRSDSRDE